MGLVVVEGLLVFALVLAGVREAVMTAIPVDLRRAKGQELITELITAGLG